MTGRWRKSRPGRRASRLPLSRRAGATAVISLAAAIAALVASSPGRGQDVDRTADLADAPLAHSAGKPNAQRPGHPVLVYVGTHPRGRRIPRDFLGLSYELSSLPQIASFGTTGNLAGLLRSLGGGVLRFGGVSADSRVAWSDAQTPRPPWAAGTVGPDDLRRLAYLAQRSGWRVMLTIGLAHFEPAAAAREAAAAKAALGNNLAGIELGNEPDAYMRHGLREAPWTFTQYALEVAAYRDAIERAAPGIPLAGPDVSGSSIFLSWGSGEAAQLSPALLTGHHYPMGCHDRTPPSIARLLSEGTRRAEGISLQRFMSIARTSGVAFRLDETNSVSCGGTPGISDTFAAALWALGYITRNMAAGVSGMNFHGAPNNCTGYSPLCATSPERQVTGLLSARPEWYALLVARSLLGDLPVRAALTTPQRGAAPPGQRAILAAASIAPGNVLHVVLVNDEPPGAHPAAVHLHVARRFRAASVLRLTAPSPATGDGILLGGRTISPDGSFSLPRALPRARSRHGVIALSLPPSSAMLVTATR
jgi:hypothetical protein